MSNTNNNLTKNYGDYVYKPGVKVEVEGKFILDLIVLVENLIKDEIKTESKFKYNYIDTKTGKVVKNVNKEDLEKGKLQKIVDIDRTINEPTFEHSITDKGIGYAQLKNFLESIHFKNVEEGKAVHYSELNKSEVVNTEGVIK